MRRSKNNIGINYLKRLGLETPWPSLEVRAVCRELLKLYAAVAKRSMSNSRPAAPQELQKLTGHFDNLCSIFECLITDQSKGSWKLEGLADNFKHLLRTHRSFLPQAASSVLAMILHCDPRCTVNDLPANSRRPNFPYSTFPNSPGLSRLMGDHTLNAVATASLPDECRSMRQARSFVHHALVGRILDPSMESGQLLLAVAESWVRKVQAKFPRSSKDAQRLIQAGWDRLCQDLLYGVDRNPLAKRAVRASFNLACDWLSIEPSCPANLLTADFTSCDKFGADANFTAIINNPPWGETLSDSERKDLRSRFSTCGSRPDSYLAYTEKCLGLLDANGSYSLVLPAPVLSTGRAAALRNLLVTTSRMHHIVLVPDEVFRDALTRSVVLLGGGANTKNRGICNCFAVRKTQTTLTIRRNRIPHSRLQESSVKGWMKAFGAHTTPESCDSSPRLREIAEIHSGYQLSTRHIMEAPLGHTGSQCEKLFRGDFPFGYCPVLAPHSVDRWHIREVKLHFAAGSSQRNASTEWSVCAGERIVVRSILNDSVGLQSARIAFNAVPLRGVVSIKPKSVNCSVLAAILNSSRVLEWLRNQPCCQTRTRKWKMSKAELSNIPIPKVLLQVYENETGDARIRMRTLSICRQITLVTKQLSKGVEAKRDLSAPEERLNQLVNELYAIQS